MIAQAQNVHHPVMENPGTDQPPPGGRERFVLNFPTEEFIMVEVISVAGVTQLFLKPGGLVLTKLNGHPIIQLVPFRIAWLSFSFLGGHLLDEDLLLHAIQQIQPVFQDQGSQVIQPYFTLLGLVVMAIETVIRQQILHFVGHGKRSDPKPSPAPKKGGNQNQKKPNPKSHAVKIFKGWSITSL
jgi:hypothetical protein